MTGPALLRFSRVVEILKYSYPILVVMGLIAARLPLGPLVLWAVLTNLVIYVFIHMVNDLEDSGDDARDPAKARRNPVASGELSRRGALGITVATGVLCVIMLAPFPPAARGMGASLLILGVLYSWRPVRLKGVPVMDLIVHGYILAAGQILFFALLDGATLDRITLLAAAGAFIFSMGGDLYNETRDWDVDRKVGLANTAGVIGYGRARSLMYGCYAAGVITVGLACAFLLDLFGRFAS